MVWKITKDTARFSFYGCSLFAVSFFVAMLANLVQYHPLWNSLTVTLHYMLVIFLSSLVTAVAKYVAPRPAQYRHPAVTS